MTPSTVIKRLGDCRLIHFDEAYISGERLRNVVNLVADQFPEGRFSVLDIGGGNGRFSDTLLERFPNATATLLDNAKILLDLNKPDLRKTTICDSVENLDAHFSGSKFDLICLIFVLHHFVTGSYRATREYQVNVLSKLHEFLSARGRILVLEDIYQGILIPTLPGRLIYKVTSSKILEPLIRRFGANTAGVGVCFLNQHEWEETFRQAHLEVLEYHPYRLQKVSLRNRVGLHVGSMRASHFWLRPRPIEPAILRTQSAI